MTQSATKSVHRLSMLAPLWAACLAVTLNPAIARAAPLSLSEVIERALKFAPSVELADARNALSGAVAREQRGPLLPALDGGVAYYQAPGLDTVKTDRGLTSTMLTVSYTALDWGRRMAAWRAARYARQAATLGTGAARAQVVFDVKAAFFDLLRSREKAYELQASVNRLKRYVAVVESLRRTGRATASDVLRIQSTLYAAELSLSAQRSAARRASAVLGSTMGDYGDSNLEVVPISGIPPLPSGNPAESPVLRAARRLVKAAAMQVKATQAELYPTLQLQLSSGFLGVDPPDTFNNRLGALYQATISVPLFRGGALRARIEQALARQRSAHAQARHAEMILLRRLANGRIAYQNARDQLDILARSQPVADDTFALAWTRFLGGSNVSLFEVFDAYRQAELLRLKRSDEEFAARRTSAEIALLYGRTR